MLVITNKKYAIFICKSLWCLSFLQSCIRAQLQRGVHVVTHVVHAAFEMERIFNVLPRLNWYFNWFFCDHWLILLAFCLSSGFLFYALAIDGVFSSIWCGKAMDNCNICQFVVSYRSFGISMFTSSFGMSSNDQIDCWRKKQFFPVKNVKIFHFDQNRVWLNQNSKHWIRNDFSKRKFP